MIFRLIILGILFFFLFRIIRSLLFSSPPLSSQLFPEGEKKIVNDMVKDPYCGVYVDRDQAFPLRVKNKVLYFCSEECRKNYLQKDTKYFEK